MKIGSAISTKYSSNRNATLNEEKHWAIAQCKLHWVNSSYKCIIQHHSDTYQILL